MAKLRKACAYRKLERPYTRKSKYRKKAFVRANPHNLIVKYVMGDPSKEFPITVRLVTKSALQIRHNALESARKSSNRVLETKLGKGGYRFELRVFPHHVLRENPLAGGAGADRMSTGMAHPFGKPIGLAAQVKQGATIIAISCDEKDLATVKTAMARANSKFACGTQLVIDRKVAA